MWFLSQIELVPNQLAGAESGMEAIDAVAVYSDGVCLANAINLVQPSAHELQLKICEDCGVEHCNPNDRALLRRAGERLVLTPDFSAMEELFPDEGALPPDYFRERGVPVISDQIYAELRRAAPELADASALEPLSSRELARIVQWEAPAGLLGLFPEVPRIERAAVVAVSTGDVGERIERLNTRLEQLFTAPSAIRFEPNSDAAQVDYFILDNSTLEEWRVPLCGDALLADARHLAVPARA